MNYKELLMVIALELIIIGLVLLLGAKFISQINISNPNDPLNDPIKFIVFLPFIAFLVIAIAMKIIFKDIVNDREKREKMRIFKETIKNEFKNRK